MPRQSINRMIEPDERRHARMRFWQTCLLDLRFEFERVREIAACEQMRETINDARGKIERFPNLARRAAPAIRYHVRGHSSAVFAVAPVNFLDHPFPAIAAWKIQINIRPPFAALI